MGKYCCVLFTIQPPLGSWMRREAQFVVKALLFFDTTDIYFVDLEEMSRTMHTNTYGGTGTRRRHGDR